MQLKTDNQIRVVIGCVCPKDGSVRLNLPSFFRFILILFSVWLLWLTWDLADLYFGITPYMALCKAIRENNVASIEKALDRGADPNGLPFSNDGECLAPLEEAVEYNRFEAAHVLIQHGANAKFRYDGGYMMQTAKAKGDQRMIRLLQ